jgi:hypothetical protein
MAVYRAEDRPASNPLWGRLYRSRPRGSVHFPDRTELRLRPPGAIIRRCATSARLPGTPPLARSPLGGWTKVTRTTLAEFPKLPLLVFRQDFRQPGIGFLLQVVDLLSLLIGELELVLKGQWEDLSGVKRAPRTAASGSPVPRAAAPSRRAVSLPGRRQFGRIAGQHRREFVAGRRTVFVGVRPCKERLQTRIGQLRFGQLAIAVGVECHEPREGRLDGITPIAAVSIPATFRRRLRQQRSDRQSDQPPPDSRANNSHDLDPVPFSMPFEVEPSANTSAG